MQKKYLSLLATFGVLLLLGAGCNYTSSYSKSIIEGGNLKQQEASTSDGMIKNNENKVVINVEGKNFSFSPNSIKVKKGDIVTINFKSVGGFHDFVIDDFNVATKQVQTGEESSVTFIADKDGDFEFYCSVGKHREMGMVGTLVVEDNDTMME